MGIEAAIIIGVAIVVGTLAVIFLVPSASQDAMHAEEKLNITMAKEGTVVPVIYGTVRLPGNIVWWDNMLSVEIYAEGGKGGGDSQVAGYRYYIDMWQVICMGKVEFVKAYKNDKEYQLGTGDFEDEYAALLSALLKSPYRLEMTADWNDGTEDTYPDWEDAPSPYANRIPGVAHMWFQRFDLGENNTYVPTIHYVMKRDLTGCPIGNHTLTYGNNPAAIIADMLLSAGELTSSFDIDMFNDAATYWYNKDYGLNISFNAKGKVRDQIARVLSYVGGAYGRTNDDKHYVKAFDPNDSSVATLNKEDFIDFNITRRNWYDTYNDYKATFLDRTKDYTERTIGATNVANQRLQGRSKPMSIDLKGFIDITAASKRLWEIMKTESYPYATLDFRTNMSFFEVLVGQVITINHSEYGISSKRYRIISKEVSDSKTNELRFNAIQMVEDIIDDNYIEGGDPLWTRPVVEPEALVKQQLFELPYHPDYGHARAYLCLCARENSFETGWRTFVSTTGTDYQNYGVFQGWSQNGTLDETYVATTNEIDDDIGILYTPYRDDPFVDSIGRADLFALERYAIIGDEIMKFQTVTPVGSNSYRLTGVVRGLFNTDIVQHNSGATIWLTYPRPGNILTGVGADDFYVKFAPFYGDNIIDLSDASAIHFTSASIEDKASTPWPPCAIKATRSGSSVSLEWWPTNQDNPGAGIVAASSQTTTVPMLYDQDFEAYNSIDGIGAVAVVDGTTDNYNTASGFTYYVRARWNGRVSDWVSVVVGTGDGDYIGPVI